MIHCDAAMGDAGELTATLLDENQLSLEAALELIRNLLPVEPLLDVHLMKALFDRYGGSAARVNPASALRVLRLVAAVSNGSRLTAFLVQLVRHPNPEVRSKAVLLLSRANLNLTRVRTFLSSCDGRVRANAVEALWGREEPDVRSVLWEASKDANTRVAVNALLGLCKAGDRNALLDLERLAGSPDPAQRSASAWAMGEAASPDFDPVLSMLENDADPKVRAMAAKSRKKLPAAVQSGAGPFNPASQRPTQEKPA